MPNTMGNGTMGSTSGVPPMFTFITLTNNNIGNLVRGVAVYSNTPNGCDKALANAYVTSLVVGIVYDDLVISGKPANIVTTGVVAATTTQWDVVTGGTGGLTFNTLYFLDPSTAGMLTATPPLVVGQYNTLIGLALSATKMKLSTRDAIKL